MPETANAVRSVVTWFEIPVTDLERARRFYASIFEVEIPVSDFGGPMAVFPYEQPGISGCLVAGRSHPSPHGTLVYLNAAGRLDRTLELVETAGGRIDSPKTKVSDDIGYVAHIIDSEGNRVGLHASP
jgi:predicted enzyme related to lactoylglutathione lyase